MIKEKQPASQICLLSFLSIILLSSCALLSTKQPKQKTIQLSLKTVHTLDVYSEKNTIHALFSGIDKDSNQLVLRYINSPDAGKNWLPPTTVNQGLASLKKSKRGNDFQVAASDNKIMVAWRTKGGEPWTGEIVIALSNDFGQTWQQTASPVAKQYSKIDQGYFDITADNLGQFHIVWLDDREEVGNTQGVHYARFNTKKGKGVWDQHTSLEPTACTCCWLSINSDKNNNIHVLFRDDSPRDMKLISSLNHGQSWQKAKTAGSFNWEFIGCPHQGGGLTTTQFEGRTILHSVLWNGKSNNKGIYYSQSEVNKAKIAVLLPIGDSYSASGDIAAINNKHIRVIYTTGDFESQSVMTKKSDDGGLSWSNELRLTNENAEPSHPRIIATPRGFWFFWTEWQENGDAIAVISELD